MKTNKEKWLVVFANTMDGHPLSYGVAHNKAFLAREEAWKECKRLGNAQIEGYKDFEHISVEDVAIDEEKYQVSYSVRDLIITSNVAFSIQKVYNI